LAIVTGAFLKFRLSELMLDRVKLPIRDHFKF